MSDLTRFRDHARAMADTPTAAPAVLTPSDSERQLWARLADEVDQYLSRHPDVVRTPTDDDQPLDFDTVSEVPC